MSFLVLTAFTRFIGSGAQIVAEIEPASVLGPQPFERSKPKRLEYRLSARMTDAPPLWDRSTPAEFRSDVFEDALDGVCVVVHTQLVRDGEEQGVGCRDGLVMGELLNEYVGFGSV